MILDHAPVNITNLVERAELTVTAGEAVAPASPEAKERIAAMTENEAVVEAQRIAKTASHRRREKAQGQTIQTAAGGAMQEPSSLIEAFSAFFARWHTSADEERAQLNSWLQLDANSSARETLRLLASLRSEPS